MISYLQYGFIGLMLLGNNIPAIAGHPLYQRVQQNRWMYFIGAYFLTNTLQKMLSQTGAFEVYVDNELIFSKLALNRMPTIQEILGRLRQM